jgi:hypothetical protein
MAPATPAATPDPLFDELKRLTGLKEKGPPGVKVVRTQKRGDVTVTELMYTSLLGGPVPALLVRPPGRGRFPAILFQHWGEGTKTELLDEAVSLARAGVVSLLVDVPFVRPDPWRRPMSGPQAGDTTQRTPRASSLTLPVRAPSKTGAPRIASACSVEERDGHG